ncbi:MAG: DUF4402 domain-containing protein [Alphaproteobacteria bacterium]|nr:DUF4402 domain-containing protein [Alphaproteobacteria bacterium]
MRKYFLTCTVALLATSTANATTDYAEVTAKATIEVATQLDCSELDFGTIVVKQNNAASTVTIPQEGRLTYTGDVLSVEDYSRGLCRGIDDEESYSITSTAATINLIGEKSKEIITANVVPDAVELFEFEIEGVLNIPQNVTADTYIGSYTLTTIH